MTQKRTTKHINSNKHKKKPSIRTTPRQLYQQQQAKTNKSHKTQYLYNQQSNTMTMNSKTAIGTIPEETRMDD